MNDMVITNQGHELIAKMIAGTTTATFTKVQTSSYDYSTETLENLTSLYDVKQEVLVSSVSRTDTALVEVLAAISNEDLTEGYYVKALGLLQRILMKMKSCMQLLLIQTHLTICLNMVENLSVVFHTD